MKLSNPKNVDIILHIGLPKTGSSAIQKYCLEHSKELLKKGFYYPSHSIDQNGISGGHSELFSAVKEENVEKAKKFIEKSVKSAKGKHATLILSNEGLHLKPNELHALLSAYKVHVIAFFRSPIDNYFSSYNQMVKRHYFTRPIQEYVRNTLRSSKEYLYHTLLKEWKAAFGAQFAVLPYVNKASVTVIDYFLDYLSIEKSHLTTSNQSSAVNRSYCFAALELKRLINYVLSEDDRKLNHKLDSKLQALSDSDKYLRGNLAIKLHPSENEALEKKFNQVSVTIQKEFAFTLEKTEIKLSGDTSSLQILRETAELVEILKSQCNDVYRAIQEKIKFGKWHSINNDQHRLSELFDCVLNHTQTANVFFNEHVLRHMPNYTEVDFLRETAKVLWLRGDIESAFKLISRAYEKRKHGPVIKTLYQQIKDEFERRNA